jgi:spoIIIJ-associated protein
MAADRERNFPVVTESNVAATEADDQADSFGSSVSTQEPHSPDAMATDGASAISSGDSAGSADSADDADSADSADGDVGSLLVQEGDIAADYLERLLDIIDYDGDIDLDVENDRAVVAIVGDGLQALVGPQGQTLDALQELTRLAVQQRTGTRSRLMLDVSGHRQARREALSALAQRTATEVLEGNASVRMDPMNPFERKIIHDTVAAIDGVESESEGEEPNRRVVVLPRS